MILEDTKKKRKTKKKDADQEAPEKIEEEKTDGEIAKEIEEMLLLAQGLDNPKQKVVSLYGDIDEENARDVVHAMRILESGFTGDYESNKFELIVSTNGGSALEMFSIYDTIRMIKEQAPVSTVGLGKVMSAGVLILASGTKGHRKIGKHCRVMIHGVASGYAGSIHSLENELEEVQWISRKVNVYLTAEQSVEYGIADEVF